MVTIFLIMALLECVKVVRLFPSIKSRQLLYGTRFYSSINDITTLDDTKQQINNETKVFKMKRKKGSRDGLGKPKGYYDTESRYVLEYGSKSGLPDKITDIPQKPFLVLGIESSCDDTGAAVVSSTGEILSNIVYSQYEIHEKFGGVVPSLAMEAHKSNINKAVENALTQAGLSSVDEVDAIAVTKGPGLEVCLRVGLRKAQVGERQIESESWYMLSETYKL